MKHSSTWFASILITSALLLSGARDATAESPSQPNQRSQTETQAQQHYAVASPAPAIVNQPSPKPTANTGATYIYNQYKQASPLGDFPTWLEAIATILLVIFAGRQMRFVRRSTQATENAAKAASDNAQAARDAAIATERYVEMTEQMVEAAKQSARAAEAGTVATEQYVKLTAELVRTSQETAKIAELALNVERPYVFIETQELKIRETTGRGLFAATILTTPADAPATYAEVSVSFTLKNRGKGIAKITGVKLRLLVMPRPVYHVGQSPSLLTAALVRLGRSKRVGRYNYGIQHPILGPNEPTEFGMISGISVPIDKWKELMERNIPAISIEIRYDDVFERSHLTRERFTYEFGMLFSNPPKRKRE
jgi:hypothetical protein